MTLVTKPKQPKKEGQETSKTRKKSALGKAYASREASNMAATLTDIFTESLNDHVALYDAIKRVESIASTMNTDTKVAVMLSTALTSKAKQLLELKLLHHLSLAFDLGGYTEELIKRNIEVIYRPPQDYKPQRNS